MLTQENTEHGRMQRHILQVTNALCDKILSLYPKIELLSSKDCHCHLSNSLNDLHIS